MLLQKGLYLFSCQVHILGCIPSEPYLEGVYNMLRNLQWFQVAEACQIHNNILAKVLKFQKLPRNLDQGERYCHFETGSRPRTLPGTLHYIELRYIMLSYVKLRKTLLTYVNLRYIMLITLKYAKLW